MSYRTRHESTCQDGVVNVAAVEVSDIADEPTEDVVLLDVREADEWAAGHAPHAVHLPMSQLAARLDEVPPAERINVICRSGGRSGQVTAYLNAQGGSAFNVIGGMQAWQQAGKSMVADSGAQPVVL